VTARGHATVASAFAALALGSAAVGAPRIARYLRHVYATWGAAAGTARTRAIEHEQRFSSAQWEFFARHLHAGDRYVLRTPLGPRRGFSRRRFVFETYADYRLLPAVAVERSSNANVVLYLDERAPPRARCLTSARDTCVERTR
jgi:hypothetical protein